MASKEQVDQKKTKESSEEAKKNKNKKNNPKDQKGVAEQNQTPQEPDSKKAEGPEEAQGLSPEIRRRLMKEGFKDLHEIMNKSEFSLSFMEPEDVKNMKAPEGMKGQDLKAFKNYKTVIAAKIKKINIKYKKARIAGKAIGDASNMLANSITGQYNEGQSLLSRSR